MGARFWFEGIRCFPTRQDVPIRPLTILLGENSSGKTTFLALYRALTAMAAAPQPVSFNEPPFLLGAYDQIASYRGGRAGRVRSFSLGVVLTGGPGWNCSFEAEFISSAGQPSNERVRMMAGDSRYGIKRARNSSGVTLTVQRGHDEPVSVASSRDFPSLNIPPLFIPSIFSSPSSKALALPDVDWEALRGAWDEIQKALGPSTYAFAPIRTSPQRTYDPIGADARPEGSHVPLLLANLSRLATAGQWEALRSGLSRFGSQSGLFDEIKVVRKGNKESDPFQIGVNIGGPTVNLVDVGYGVSQVLPIVVDTLQRGGSGVVFLMQQPEVHLHPRAQAELGSFFARLVTNKQRFVIETHSDYLVDRVRMEVRRCTLKPDDVSLLYFERHEQAATIHHVELDERGNVTNPPPGYRQFFMDEELSLLEA